VKQNVKGSTFHAPACAHTYTQTRTRTGGRIWNDDCEPIHVL